MVRTFINQRMVAIGCLLFGLLLAPGLAQAELRIFACEPEWAALARELVPDATIDVATTHAQDPHYVQARPSLIAKVRQADLVFCTGAELEIGWLPALLQKANNAAVMDPQLGLLYATEQVALLDVQTHADRSQGDTHATGNPHVHLSPQRVLGIAHALNRRLQLLQPEQAKVIDERHQAFAARWLQAQDSWQQQAQGLRGLALVAYHSSYRYLFDWLGLVQVGDLEPKPGLPPTSGHLARLLAELRQAPPAVIVHTAYQQSQAAEWLGGQLAVPVLQLPYTVGDGDSQNLFTLYQQIIEQLLPLADKGGADGAG